MHSIHTTYRSNSKSRKLLCYFEHNHIFTCKRSSKFICHNAILSDTVTLLYRPTRATFHFMSYIQDATTLKVQTACAAEEVMNVPFHWCFSSLQHLICRNPTGWRTQYHLRNLVLRLLEFHLSARNRSQMIPQRSRAALQQIASISHAHVQEKHT